MRYVIKEVVNSNVTSYLEAKDYFVRQSSNFVRDIEQATHFNSIKEALDVIRRRDKIYDWSELQPQFTIVGIKEVSTPRYEEVIL